MQELALDITIAATDSNTEYTCRVSFHGGLTASEIITIRTNGKNQLYFLLSLILLSIIVTVIRVTVTESTSGDGAIAGQSYTLECGVSGHELLADVSITYEWTRGSSSVGNEKNMTYTFTPTAGDDGVIYHCAATVTSSSLSNAITSNGSRTISVLGMH